MGCCAPQQGACKLTLNIKAGVIEEALVETLGCTGMTHSAAMASEILPGTTLLEGMNTDLVCAAINVAMRSSPVPAHVEMMGLIGMGNNPMVGASVAVAVALEQARRG